MNNEYPQYKLLLRGSLPQKKMFGDNVSVYNSDSKSHDKFHRRHIDISLHRVREVIAAGVISFRFLAGKDNSADILSKHWAY